MRRKKPKEKPTEALTRLAYLIHRIKEESSSLGDKLSRYKKKVTFLVKKHGEKDENGSISIEIPGGSVTLQRRSGRMSINEDACASLDPTIRKAIRSWYYDAQKIRDLVDQGKLSPELAHSLVAEGDPTFALYVKVDEDQIPDNIDLDEED